jgi:hypothetical protein
MPSGQVIERSREGDRFMAVKQVCVRMTNKPGELHQVTEVLKLEGVNIRAISVLDPGEDALVRMMVDDPERACNSLASKDFDYFERDVVAVEVPDHPGGLHVVLGSLKEAGINILQLYSYLGRSGQHAILILRVDKNVEAEETLKKNYVHVFGEEVYDL